MQRHRTFHRGGCAGVLLCLAFAVHAGEADTRPTAAPAAPAPTARTPMAAAGAPATASAVPIYRSALEGFRPYRADEPLRDWREVNAEVGRLGGHMGHMHGRGEREGGR